MERELLLLKLRLGTSQVGAVRAAVERAGGRILADDVESFLIELTDSESQISLFIAHMAQFGEVLEVIRSGALAVLRGTQTLHVD